MLEVQSQTTGIPAFLKESNKYIQTSFPEMDLNKIFNESLKGEVKFSGILGFIVSILGDEVSLGISSMITVLIIIVIHSILKAIIENLGNDSTAKIAYFIQYLIIVTLIVNTFVDMLDIVKTAISSVISFMNLLIPILITLMLTTGCIVSGNVTQMILIFLINIMGNLINLIIIPLLMISTTLSIVSNFSDKANVSRLSKFIKSAVLWILGIVLTVFVCTLSIEGTLSSSVDRINSQNGKSCSFYIYSSSRKSYR